MKSIDEFCQDEELLDTMNHEEIQGLALAYILDKAKIPTYLDENYSTKMFKLEVYREKLEEVSENMGQFWEYMESYANQEGSKLDIKEVEKAKQNFIPELKAKRQIPPLNLSQVGSRLLYTNPKREAEIKLMRVKYMSAFPLFQRILINDILSINSTIVSENLKKDYNLAMEKIYLYP